MRKFAKDANGVAMEASNPFTPSFGRIPAHFAGRTAILESMKRALADECRTSPDLAMHL